MDYFPCRSVHPSTCTSFILQLSNCLCIVWCACRFISYLHTYIHTCIRAYVPTYIQSGSVASCGQAIPKVYVCHAQFKGRSACSLVLQLVFFPRCLCFVSFLLLDATVAEPCSFSFSRDTRSGKRHAAPPSLVRSSPCQLAQVVRLPKLASSSGGLPIAVHAKTLAPMHRRVLVMPKIFGRS